MTTINMITDSKIVEAVKKAIGGKTQAMRNTFDFIADAEATFLKAVAAAGEGVITLRPMDEEGNVDNSVFDSEQIIIGYEPNVDADGNQIEGEDEQRPIYGPSIQAVVAIVGGRVEGKGDDKGMVGIKAISLFPQPHPMAFLQDVESIDWLTKIIVKEASHVQFRPLRNAESVEELEAGFASQPRTIEAIRQSYRGDSIDLTAVDAVYSTVRAHIKKKQPMLDAALPGKAELIKAMRNAAYATHSFPELEQRGLFVKVAQAFITAIDIATDPKSGESRGLDSSTFAQLVAERDSQVYNPQTVEVTEEGLDAATKASLDF